MARRHWTILLVSDDQTQVRQVRLPRELVRAGIAGVLLVFSVLTSLAGGFFFRETQRLNAERIAVENRLLEKEVRTIRTSLLTLQSSLEQLGRRDAQYRLLAGLEPVDPQVQLAGVGGPGTRTVAADSLFQVNRELGELAFDVSADLSTMLRRARMLSASWTEANDSLESKHDRLRATPSIFPTNGYLSSAFSRKRMHPILHRARPHEGIDISAPHGTPIYAAARGRVTYTGRRGDYGNMVEIDHGYGIVTRYAHIADNGVLVRRGQTVERGDQIALVGSTGLAVGPHLHYEVLKHGKAENPDLYILDGEVIPD